ncbi:DeoR/GlpR family DNA-binding transcription regulator [Amphibacillus sp. MSJ-3]|uniref:DeoR/GlpR family DNA-binding transcription regulator n=1 Tax=Amphibacillus sp. MSJ-3 TaxID=2841505 RepID=UPI001C0EF62A|nr:DeoR/GlpR family DNA-binding transcription regulator [Amphibacillus sp. MSJ-3]MBU5593864.1 DeoR/GlpR family DNA-binding transcription regulator [Amphibacillus sp. MSJ-3]
MLFQHRKEKILNLLSQKETVSIHDLVVDVGVSESTLRRDLIALEEMGLLTRVHGGATTVKNIRNEQKMSQKERSNFQTKVKIAKYCSHLIKANSQIFIDAGTATLELVRVLPNNKNIHMVTNGVDQALLALQRGIKVTLLGGPVKQNTHAIIGLTAFHQLERMNFSFAFIGMNGISKENGLTTTNLDEAMIKECAMQQSQNIRILMDDSKLNHVYQYKVKAPSQAIILLNRKAQIKAPETVEKISNHYDLHFIED